jgi:serine/threonine protein kinase
MKKLRAGDPAWVGPFRLRERLGDGDGGLGPLFLGQSPLDHLVAVRVLHPGLAADKALRERLARDVAAARKVSGPRVAPLIGAGLSGLPLWVAWDWVPGEPLAATVPPLRPALPWPAFAVFAEQLAEGLWSLHQRGVVHGGLVPGSVILGKDGAVISGFGITAAVTALRARADAGALEFMSPEQAAGGEPTPASDMFSLGAILTYALTGAGPYHQRTPAGEKGSRARRAIDYDDAPDLDGVPVYLRPLIERCLRANPDFRPPSESFATEIADRIRDTPRRQIEALTGPQPPQPGPVPPLPAATVQVPAGTLNIDPALISSPPTPPSAKSSNVSAGVRDPVSRSGGPIAGGWQRRALGFLRTTAILGGILFVVVEFTLTTIGSQANFQTLKGDLSNVHLPSGYRLTAEQKAGTDCRSGCSLTQTWIWAPGHGHRTAADACSDADQAMSSAFSDAGANDPYPANVACDYYVILNSPLHPRQGKRDIHAIVKTHQPHVNEGFVIQLVGHYI